MNSPEKTWGWDLATNGETLAMVLGGYSSFHDSAVRSFCMRRTRESREGVDGHQLPGMQTRDVVDVCLEVLHNRYGPPPVDGRPDRIVVIDCLDVRTSEIDVNAMLEEATIMEMSLALVPGGLLKLDLLPNVGLDVRLTCAEVVISDMLPYVRPA
ncbi:conserved hypothetical protein [Paraburkholderia piptadeniae]|uniref:Uncharacterized protein n=1 Tax=Paraburkholderia piptadeniae TaxID=1701573 RepID=A0A1N7SII9_9BURK|nr:hypothetical protein [Paraburkholderia piptadeniae]SIT47213.1 conserved hypothetical protein [Paraburkholderia piptadeniae]